MRIMRALHVALAGLVAVLAIGVATPALADRPSIQEIQLDGTVVAPRPSQACGFPVLRHDEGTIRLITRYDENGNPIREIDVYHVRVTYSASPGGPSITGFTGGIENIVYHTDGSLTITSAGPDGWTRSPGGGHLWGGTGSLVTEIDATGQEVISRESGPNYFFGPALCDAITP